MTLSDLKDLLIAKGIDWDDASNGELERKIDIAKQTVLSYEPVYDYYKLSTDPDLDWQDLSSLSIIGIDKIMPYAEGMDLESASELSFEYNQNTKEVWIPSYYLGMDVYIKYYKDTAVADLTAKQIEGVILTMQYLWAMEQGGESLVNAGGTSWKRGQVSVSGIGEGQERAAKNYEMQFQKLFGKPLIVWGYRNQEKVIDVSLSVGLTEGSI